MNGIDVYKVWGRDLWIVLDIRVGLDFFEFFTWHHSIDQSASVDPFLISLALLRACDCSISRICLRGSSYVVSLMYWVILNFRRRYNHPTVIGQK